MRGPLLSMLLASGCAPDPSPLPTLPELARVPVDVVEVVGPAAPLWRVQVSWDAPVSLRLVVTAHGEDVWVERPPQVDHDVLLVGLRPDTDHEIRLVLYDGDRPVAAGAPTSFRTEPVPAGLLPIIEVLATRPARAEPGWLLLSARSLDQLGAVSMLLDESFVPRWWTTDGLTRDDLRVGPNGTLWAMGAGSVGEFGWDLTEIRRYRQPPAPDEIPLTAGPLHHEVFPEEDGSFWSLAQEQVTFDTYPASYADLTPVPPEVPVEDNPIVHVAADGTTLSRWGLADRLDRGRISWDGLGTGLGTNLDWVHANGVVPDGTGGVVVSVRNQDALVRLTAEGDLDWILGDPLGWSPAFGPHLLTPIGPVQWPYHQHGPEWHPDEQLLVVFDNRDDGHTPYGPEPAGLVTSRAVGYEVDADARTVRQLWSFDETATGPVRSKFLGDADRLPITGNVLATYGVVTEEAGVSNLEMGFGASSARLVEFDSERPDEPALDIRLRSDGVTDPLGWHVYRARKVPRPVD